MGPPHDSQGECAPALRLDAPLTVLRGVGPQLAARLRDELGIATLHDLLRCFPRRYRAVLQLDAPTAAALDQRVRLDVRVDGARRAWLPGRRSMVTILVTTSDGTAVELRFFNQPYLRDAYPPGSRRTVEGVLRQRGRRFLLEQARVLPRDHGPRGPCTLSYPEITGVSAERFAGLLRQALDRIDLAEVPQPALPAALARELPERGWALRAMHAPESLEQHEAARRRFAVEEAVGLFERVEQARRARRAVRAPEVRVDTALERRILGLLPFALRDPQQACVQKIWRLLRGPAPMGLLLEGDVGTGKTAVAVCAALAVVAAGYQVAFLAPTELLAEQHHAVLQAWLGGSEVRTALLTASGAATARTAVEQELRAGRAMVVVGTHALLSQRTAFANLGLLVVDEQHRFGVAQRARLRAKGEAPHELHMTATPIPRTLALAWFGDLDHALLHGAATGRGPAPARYVPKPEWPRAVAAIRRRVARGQQVFVVCPKIGSDQSRGGAVRMHAELQRQGFDAQLVHGELPAERRQEVLTAFRGGAFRVLVGTTVLEVGVDVPAATLMVVAGAERFGLATLHQLRGRVGRGARRGLCLLCGEDNPRVRAVCRSTDGFALAEQDLALRGAGELLGVRQSGAFELRALDPSADRELLLQVREAVRAEAGQEETA